MGEGGGGVGGGSTRMTVFRITNSMRFYYWLLEELQNAPLVHCTQGLPT